MKDIKDVFRYIVQLMEVQSLLPSKMDSFREQKRKMKEYRERASYININTSKSIRYKANAIMSIAPLITIILIFYKLKIGFCIPLFILGTIVFWFLWAAEFILGWICFELVQHFRKNGLIKGTLKILLALIIFLIFATIDSLTKHL